MGLGHVDCCLPPAPASVSTPTPAMPAPAPAMPAPAPAPAEAEEKSQAGQVSEGAHVLEGRRLIRLLHADSSLFAAASLRLPAGGAPHLGTIWRIPLNSPGVVAARVRPSSSLPPFGSLSVHHVRSLIGLTVGLVNGSIRFAKVMGGSRSGGSLAIEPDTPGRRGPHRYVSRPGRNPGRTRRIRAIPHGAARSPVSLLHLTETAAARALVGGDDGKGSLIQRRPAHVVRHERVGPLY